MKKKTKIIKRILFATLAIAVLLGGVLAFHLYQVTSKPTGHLADVQMGRFDLAGPVDAAKAATIKSAVLQLPGVQHCFVNADAGIVTYAYDRGKQTQVNVIDHVQIATSTPVTQFVVSAADLANSCPVRMPSTSSLW